jgi:poly(3-hydroxybutyrate) depolymerase
MPQGEIEKNISLFIKRQFPAIYREDGPELVQLVEDYYKWSETATNQHVYQQRRYFETRDVDTTLESMIIFFKKKFLADLPLKSDIIKFIIKNILDLYRSKGTARSIELFFAIFYQEHDIEIIYPSERMQKVSDSDWKQGVYLQMFPNNNFFLSKSGKEYTYFDLLARNIEGSITKAKASVRSINFFILNGVKTPVMYLDGIQGSFKKYEDILCNINGEVVAFGKTNGSLSKFTVVERDSRKNAAGRKVGEIFDVLQKDGYAGKAIVTKVTDEVSGQIDYDLVDGGYGYTIDNTRLIVSDQVIILDNSEDGYNQPFIIGETLSDNNGNEGTVVGQNLSTVGLKMTAGQEITPNSIVSTNRGSNEITIDLAATGNTLSAKNSSSPGDLYPDTSDTDDVIVTGLTDTSVASVITDVITPHLATVLNAADYEANAPMSGTASPVNLSTPIDQAFDIQDLTIGRISGFANINPGADYNFDVFAIAQDSLVKNLDRKNQLVKFNDAGDAGSFDIGDRIKGATSNIFGVVKDINQNAGVVTITPFNYSGLNSDENIVLANNPSFQFNVAVISNDYNSQERFGDNAVINAETEFAIGKVQEVNILNSGFGYVEYEVPDNEIVDFSTGIGELRTANNDFIAFGIIEAETQGNTEGYWAGQNSHLSGYRIPPGQTANTQLEYYDSGMRIQDSDFFQEYSYQVKSSLPLQEYEKLLKENVHLAGTKLFGDFIFKAYAGGTIKPRFLRLFNDQGTGSPFDVAEITELNAGVTNYTSDSTLVSADHAPGGTGGLTLSTGSAGDLTQTRNWSQGFHDYDVTVGMPSSGTGPYPVAILLHGNGGNGAGMVTNFANDLPGHILIGVQGYENSWNIANETSNGPDIEMLEELIETLKSYNNVDETKIRIVGTSNGGALALRAAIEIDDPAVDAIVCMISQMHEGQYRNSNFYYPSSHENTGNAFDPYDGYDTQQTTIPLRRLLFMNGEQDTVVPFGGNDQYSETFGTKFISAEESAWRFAQAYGWSGYNIPSGNRLSYGANSQVSNYGNVIWLNDDVGHVVSPDMRNMLTNYLENNFDISY